MAVSAQTVANIFLRFANEEGLRLTNMQLQKLVFLGQGYALALLKNPVYYHNTHAWQWGPVVPKLYKDLQKYGSGRVTDDVPIPSDDAGQITTDELNVLRAVWNAYKKYSGSQLSEITHRPGTPWSKTWETSKFGIIPLPDMQEYYSGLISRKS